MGSIIGGSTRRHDLVFYRSGRIDIMARVVKAIGINEGDVIDIYREDEEYYLYIRARSDRVTGRHKARCFSANKNSKRASKSFRAYSKTLTDAILANFPSEVDKVRIPAGSVVAHVPHIGRAITLITRVNL